MAAITPHGMQPVARNTIVRPRREGRAERVESQRARILERSLYSGEFLGSGRVIRAYSSHHTWRSLLLSLFMELGTTPWGLIPLPRFHIRIPGRVPWGSQWELTPYSANAQRECQ